MATLVATSPPPPPMALFSSEPLPPPPVYSPPPLPPSEPHIHAPAPVFAPKPVPFQNHHDREALRPAKNLEAFNSLLPPPVEFVEGSSTGMFAIPEGKYEPINASPKANGTTEPHSKPRPSSPSPKKKHTADARDLHQFLYSHPIDTTWPSGVIHGEGLYNLGNTCFLNSALQCLLHTPPLLRVLGAHSTKADQCRVKGNGFCMSCAMKQVMLNSFQKGRSFSPDSIVRNLHLIAKHLKKGRQEDTHEFLRYAIDSMQKSCLSGYPPKLDAKITETTWVHRIFGGKLRSRVTCTQCGHNSDTFDSILDLSIDIYNITGLKDALKKFTAIDYLKGADKYKCEKCKRAVNAEKRFTVHEAPVVLTVHLKRFTPLGRKLAHPIRYDERINLQPAMSEGQYGPTYSLYGVISHAGGGPNSGHYYAHVKAANGAWYEMNDESVEKQRCAPTNMKSAYMLFYLREKGQSLEAALNSVSATSYTNGVVSKKRKVVLSDNEGEGKGEREAKPIIGPAIPTHLLTPNGPRNGVEATPRQSPADPQAELLRRKIAEVRNSQKAQLKHTRTSLVPYGDEDEEKGEVIDRPDGPSSVTQNNPAPYGNAQVNGNAHVNGNHDTSSPSHPPPTSPLPTPTSSPTEAIPPSSFYATTSSTLSKRGSDEPARKRKSPDGTSDVENTPHAKATAAEVQQRSSAGQSAKAAPRTSFGAGNPFGRSRVNDSIQSNGEQLFRPRKLQKKHYGGRKSFGY